MKNTVILSLLVALLLPNVRGWGSKDPGKVLLQDVQVLTLRNGQMTTSRRTSPVPQLKCVGGSAMGRFNPQVVQCYNRGSDGVDIQWECKADMDNLYRFGEIDVVCEGYNYPDDAYITKGSCGLEYTLEYTKEGRYGSQKEYYSPHDSSSWSAYGSSRRMLGTWATIVDYIVFIGTAFLIYILYVTCIASGRSLSDRQYSATSDDYPAGGGGGAGGWTNPGGRNTRGQGPNVHGYDDASCGGDRFTGQQRNAGTGGGFWTGMATGGLLGYIFGGTPTAGYYGGGHGFGASGFGGWAPRPQRETPPRGGGSGSPSSGTRTASGFGGTRRR